MSQTSNFAALKQQAETSMAKINFVNEIIRELQTNDSSLTEAEQLESIIYRVIDVQKKYLSFGFQLEKLSTQIDELFLANRITGLELAGYKTLIGEADFAGIARKAKLLESTMKIIGKTIASSISTAQTATQLNGRLSLTDLIEAGVSRDFRFMANKDHPRLSQEEHPTVEDRDVVTILEMLLNKIQKDETVADLTVEAFKNAKKPFEHLKGQIESGSLSYSKKIEKATAPSAKETVKTSFFDRFRKKK